MAVYRLDHNLTKRTWKELNGESDFLVCVSGSDTVLAGNSKLLSELTAPFDRKMSRVGSFRARSLGTQFYRAEYRNAGNWTVSEVLKEWNRSGMRETCLSQQIEVLLVSRDGTEVLSFK
ncbi:MAG: hypothetical protein R3C53_24770 [Pirellulaceae bacterium]